MSLEIPADVMARQVGEEIVILDLASGNYFGLDPVGARIWQLIGERKGRAEILAALLAEYEVAPGVLQADLDRLVEELVSRGLLRRS